MNVTLARRVAPVGALLAASIIAIALVVPVAQQGPPQYRLHVRSTLEDLAGVPRGFGAPGYISPGSYTGNKTLLVILLEFQGKDHNIAYTQAYYQNLLFNKSNSLSMASFFHENSYGRLNLTGTVTPWLRSSRTMAYYGEDSGPFPNIDDENGNIFEMAREAVQLANPFVDFSQFDEDSDGFVDNLVIIHAGAGQESSGVADDIWSHRWNIQPAENVDGVKASAYATLAESSPMGVFAHEYGHLLGLPDFYDYTYSGVVFAGNWAVMDSGSWNGVPAGTKPSHFISWSKMQMGFILPSEREVVGINEARDITIYPTSGQSLPTGNARVAVVNISTGIYYTIEVRDTTIGPFESSLPDGGVIISFCNDSARDEVFYGRPGAVVVMNAQPTDPTKNNAPFDLGPGENPTFQDTARNIVVELLSRNGTTGAYTVRVSYSQLRVSWFHVNGTGDWRTYPGQTFNLTVTLQNTGTSTLSGITAVLDTTVAGISILQGSSSYGNMAPGAIANGSSDYRVQLGAVSTTPLNFSMNVTHGSGTNIILPLHLPLHLESNVPSLSMVRPVNGSSFNASTPFVLLGNWADDVGLLGAWYQVVPAGSGPPSAWLPIDFNATSVYGQLQIRDIGMFDVHVRVVDTSGNVNESVFTVWIVDQIAPFVLLSINDMEGEPMTFAIVGVSLYIVAVVFDNHEVASVGVSINGGPFIDIAGYEANITVTGGAGGLAYGTYPGYAYPWTPAIEGENLIVLRAVDMSGNATHADWRITVLSMETIITLVIVGIVVVVSFSAVIAYTGRRKKHSSY